MARILVPFDGGPSGEEALHAACRMARDNDDEVQVVYVVRISHHLPIWADLSAHDDHVAEVFARAEAIAERHNIPLTAVHVTARYVGWGIVAAAEGCDLVLFGRRRRRRLHKRLLPDATLRHVAARVPCQVLLLPVGAGATAPAARPAPPRPVLLEPRRQERRA